MKKLGILGGLGPETTAKFYLNIIKKCSRVIPEKRPEILIHSVPMNLEEEADFIRGKSLGTFQDKLVKSAREIERDGAEIVVIPCNSAHIFVENIRQSVNIKVLSIVEEAIAFINTKNMKKVGIISSGITRKSKMFTKGLRQKGILSMVPTMDEQKTINRIIIGLARGKRSLEWKKKMETIINRLKESGAEAIFLACTDLQLLSLVNTRKNIFDTMTILADSTIKEMIIN